MKAGNRREETRVIWLGPRNDAALDDVAEALRNQGIELEVSERAHDLAAAVSLSPRAVIVVSDHVSPGSAEEALMALESVYRPIPVVILMDHSAFGRYYDLMRRGATYFYERGEGTDRIVRGVRHAAARAA
jgi:DNA-binding NtrC family response regulator